MQYVTPRDRGVTGLSEGTESPAKIQFTWPDSLRPWIYKKWCIWYRLYHISHMTYSIILELFKLKNSLPLAAAKSEIAIFISKIMKYASVQKMKLIESKCCILMNFTGRRSSIRMCYLHFPRCRLFRWPKTFVQPEIQVLNRQWWRLFRSKWFPGVLNQDNVLTSGQIGAIFKCDFICTGQGGDEKISPYGSFKS